MWVACNGKRQQFVQRLRRMSQWTCNPQNQGLLRRFECTTTWQERASLAKQLAQTEAHLAAVAAQQALMAKELEDGALHGAALEQELDRLTRERDAAAAQVAPKGSARTGRGRETQL